MARIAFLGDTMLGGAAKATFEQHGYDYAFDGIRHLWAGADLVVANLEAPVTSRRQRLEKAETGDKRYWNRVRPASTGALVNAWIGLVSLGNNHVCDYGSVGLFDTIDALEDHAIRHCGAGATDKAARRPAYLDVQGLRFGFLSVMQRYDMYVDEDLYATRDHPGPALLRTSRVTADIAAVRERADVCVVLVHWGHNYAPLSLGQQRLARRSQEAGAHLVVGHHPHIPHPVEVIDRTPVVYSLGNAAYGSVGNPRRGPPECGLAAVAELDGGGVTGLDLAVINVANQVVQFRPRPVVDAESLPFLDSLGYPAVRSALEAARTS